MNALIQLAAEKGCSNSIYDIFGLLGILCALLFCIRVGKKMGIKTWQTVVTITVVLSVSFFAIHVIIIDCLRFLVKNTGLKTVMIQSIVRVLLLMPMVGLIVGRIIKVNGLKICDLLAYVPMILGGIGAIGCVFTGCCAGYPSAIGIYNMRTQTTVFPVQLLNAAIMLLIAAYIYWKARKNAFVTDGSAYPTMLVLFCISRIGTEFLTDNVKLIMGCSVLSIHAMKDLLVAVCVLRFMHNKGQYRNNIKPKCD